MSTIRRLLAPRQLFPCSLLAAVLVLAFATSASAQDGADRGASNDRAAEDERITFDVALDESRGGGRVVGSAGDFDYAEGRYLLASGGVELKYRDVILRAERLRLDIPENSITAEGEVVLDEGPRRLAGDELEYDLDTRTGRLKAATAYVDPDIYMAGDVISKTGPMTYTIEDGVFTSCEGDTPAWSIATTRADVTLEEYARIRNARLRFGPVPAFYFPYILWPATTERSSGWLVPKPGYSSREGFHISTAYYKTLGRSADATFYFDLSTEEYHGIGAELRYRPSEDTQGILEVYNLFQPEGGFAPEDGGPAVVFDPDRLLPVGVPATERPSEDRWKLAYFHETNNLWTHWRAVVNLQLYSDFDYLKDVERNFDRQSQSFIYSNAFLTSNIGPHSINIMVDQREQVRGNLSQDTRRQLPEVEYRLRSTQIGDSDFYFGLRSSVNYFDLEIEPPPAADGADPAPTFTADYGRFDFAPVITWSLPGTSWLNASIDLGGRVTHYTDSLTPLADSPDGQDFAGESLTRTFPTAALEIVGPSFSRIFETGGERWSKFKHLIEPRFTYRFVDEFDEQNQVLLFDEVDVFNPVNVAVVSIVNRLLAKPADESKGGAFEIASLSIAQGFNLDDQLGQTGSGLDENGEPVGSSEGPIFTTFRFNPDRDTNLKVDLQYNTLFSRLQSFGLSGATDIGRHKVDLTWFTRWNAETGDETDDQVRLRGSIELIRDRLTFDALVNYNLRDDLLLNPDGTEPDRLQSQAYALNFTGSCYSWQLSYREQNFTGFEDRDFRFSLTLKNVGTFLDLRESF
ncbi:MAG: LPS assembly protein LptD [Acidobacteriota bacterium]